MLHFYQKILKSSVAAAVFGALWAAPLDPVAAQDDLRERYKEATVALGCNGRLMARAGSGPAREKANDKSLRAHGFTRSSYSAAGFDFSDDHVLTAMIGRRIRNCPRPHPLELLPSGFNGAFSAGGLKGTVKVKIEKRSAVFTIKVMVDGVEETISFRSVKEVVNSRGQGAGSSPWTWRVSGVLRQANFYGTLHLRVKGRSRRCSFTALPSD